MPSNLSGPSGAATPEERNQLAQLSVPKKQVTLFTRQLAALLQGSVPLVLALSSVTEQPEAPGFGLIIQDIGAQVGSGQKLSFSLSKYPKVFSKLYITMVEVGESSGVIDDSLVTLSEWMERDDSLAQKVRSALTYPGFVLVLSAVLTFLLFSCILPGFVSIFEEMNAPLPLITKIVVFITKLAQNPLAWAAGVGLIYFLMAQYRSALRDPVKHAKLYGYLLKIPGLGGLMFHGTAARYCSAMEVLLSSGMDMRRTLRLAGAASGNPLLEQDAWALIQNVMDGGTVSQHMSENPNIYSATILHMTVAGEEASKLPEMFSRAAYFHELEMQGKIDAVSAALEPLLLTGVSIVVGTILISIFLPLYGILSTLGG